LPSQVTIPIFKVFTGAAEVVAAGADVVAAGAEVVAAGVVVDLHPDITTVLNSAKTITNDTDSFTLVIILSFQSE
jgi:hypothetical protein